MALFSKAVSAAKPAFSSIRSASGWQAVSLKYSQYGDPVKVLQKNTETLSADLEANNVAIKFLACPINPMDINTIQGVYETKPPLPAVGGCEGVAEVVGVGSGVKNVKVGDRVVPAVPAIGSWRTHAIIPSNEVMKVSAKLPLIQAATLTVNPVSAFRMLHDYVKLKEGDVVIVNAANSTVGQAVNQIAKHYKWRTVNVILDGPDKDKIAKYLTDMGATHVITDKDFKNKDLISKLPKAKLGLNCVGGEAVADMTTLMENGSTMASYGAMSKKPMIIPTSALIFKEILFRGFWMTRWNYAASIEKRQEMVDTVVDLMLKKVLRPPVLEPVLFDDTWQEPIQRAQDWTQGKKQVFVMEEKYKAQVDEERKAFTNKA